MRQLVAQLVRGICSLAMFFLHEGVALAQSPTPSVSVAAQRNEAAVPSAEFEKMAARFEALIEGYNIAKMQLDQTQWGIIESKAPGVLGKLPRENLTEYLAKQRVLLDSIDQNIAFQGEPGVEDNLDPLFRRAESNRLTQGWKRADIGLHAWRLRRQLFGSLHEVNKLIDKNWEEFRLIESPTPESKRKPWQKEIHRLLDVARPANDELVEMQKPDPVEEAARAAEISKIGRNAAADLVGTAARRLKAPGGFAGTRWLMSPDEVKAARPKARPSGDDLFEAMEWLDRPVAVTYDFENNFLVAVHVIFSKAAAEGEFEKTQDYLQTAHGKMSVPKKTGDYLLLSTYEQEQFAIHHILRPDRSESVTFFRTP